MRDEDLFIGKAAIIGMLIAAAAIVIDAFTPAQAHTPDTEECSWYGGVAGMVALSKNSGTHASVLVPQLMTFITSCGALGQCPVKDSQDTKRVMNAVHQVYALTISPLDADKVEEQITAQCLAEGKTHSTQPPSTLTPDLRVPYSGPQVEG